MSLIFCPVIYFSDALWEAGAALGGRGGSETWFSVSPVPIIISDWHLPGWLAKISSRPENNNMSQSCSIQPIFSQQICGWDSETRPEARWRASLEPAPCRVNIYLVQSPQGNWVSADSFSCLSAGMPQSVGLCSWKIWQTSEQNSVVYGAKECICGSERKLCPYFINDLGNLKGSTRAVSI